MIMILFKSKIVKFVFYKKCYSDRKFNIDRNPNYNFQPITHISKEKLFKIVFFIFKPVNEFHELWQFFFYRFY